MTFPARDARASSNLSALACEAAVELDNLMTQHAGDLEAVRVLGNRIRSAVIVPEPATPSSLLDATTAVALHRAIGGGGNTLDELLVEAKAFSGRLESATATALLERETECRALRDFCLALSRHASALSYPTPEASRHPLRRVSRV